MSSQIGQTWARDLRLAFNGTKGGRILSGFAQILVDKAIDWGTAAVIKRFPQPTDGSLPDPAALALLASERQIEPGPTETSSALATRLVAAIPQWRLAGSPIGMLVEMYFAGFPGAVVVTQTGRYYTITGTPNLDDVEAVRTDYTIPSWFTSGNLGLNPYIPASTDGKPAIPAGTVYWFTFDGGMDGDGNQYNSRFGILFPSTAPDPGLGTTANLDRLSRIVNRWRPAKAKCFGVAVYVSGAIWGWPVDSTWGDFGGASLPWGGTVTSYGV
jgi:hypothetical protein